jgi:homospermidine synthase
MKKKFDHKILIIGYGSVSQCTLPLLLDHVDVPLSNITVMDFEDKSKLIRKFTKRGIKFVRHKITQDNMTKTLAKYVDQGGLIIDLAWNIGANDILTWCHNNKVLYANTSVEEWNPFAGMTNKSPLQKSLYYRQMQIKNIAEGWQHGGTSAVVDHGANPGLISHFAKQGAIDIAHKLIREKKVSKTEAANLKKYISQSNFAKLGQALGIKVVHVSERDTQITNRPKEVNEFVGTWSIEGLREEGTAPSELGWGTHEKKLPEYAHVPPSGPKNQIFLAQMGMNTWVRSWIPDQEIVGMVIRHGEAFGISDRWTVWKDGKVNGKALYRPTVHYAYMPCHETLSSIHELRGLNYKLPKKQRIMSDEITTGNDILGALLMGHKYGSWWCGSDLSIQEARKLAPHQNATTLQVAAGIIAAVLWMMENPNMGVNLPDDLPHDFVLKVAMPYLGKFISTPSDWTPLKNRTVYFKENPMSHGNKQDPWQFENFRFLP